MLSPSPRPNLPSLLFHRAAKTPFQEALRHKRDRLWYSIPWKKYAQSTEEIALALLPLLHSGQRVGLMSENRPEWGITDLATLTCGGVTVPIYPTLPAKDIASILQNAECTLLFVASQAHLDTLLSLEAAQSIPPPAAYVLFDASASCDGQRILSWEQLRIRASASSLDALQTRMDAILPEDLATLIYTSGTTGEPKGVMLSHRNLLSNLDALSLFVEDAGITEAQMLSFLPLSHTFERTIGHFLPIKQGFQVAFAQDIKTLSENLQEIQPTFLVSVPSIYERLYTQTLAQIEASSPFLQKTLRWCLSVGQTAAHYEIARRDPGFLFDSQRKVADQILFQSIRKSLGGRLRVAISGGAPLSSQIAEFLLGAGIRVIEGYGLTEASPVVTATPPHAPRPGSVGKPLHGITLKILPDPGYAVGGEILVKGPNVMRGYYRLPEETARVLKDGWLFTGDIGYIDEQGYLTITDRKKDLLKLANGRYIAPQRIENFLTTLPAIQQAVVLGDRRPFCIALLVPDLAYLRSSLGLPDHTQDGDLLRHPLSTTFFQTLLEEAHRRLDLGRWEQIKRFALLPRPLSQDQDEITPTLKLKRRIIESHFRPIIERLYTSP